MCVVLGDTAYMELVEKRAFMLFILSPMHLFHVAHLHMIAPMALCAGQIL